jgi:cytochrome P450
MSDKCPYQFDLMNPEKMSKGVPFDEFSKLRTECPVALQDDSREGGTYWAVTRQDYVDLVSKNPDIFSSRENLAHPQPGGDDPDSLDIMKSLIINMDPPDHIKYRKVVRNAFTGKAVDALEPMMREYAKNIIDRIASRGSCEFVSEVAAEMPLFVICALTEMPEEKRKTFSDLVDVMIGMDDPEISGQPPERHGHGCVA